MDQPTGLRVTFLGSGSAGNCTAVSAGETTILIDCGFSARETAARLSSHGLDASRIAAVLVTHEHGDHVRGVDVFTRRHARGCRVLATSGTVRASRCPLGVDVTTIVPGEVLTVGGLEVLAFETSHDAVEPVGYVVTAGGESVGIATDTGFMTPQALEALRDVDVLGIEGNHDIEMLERGPYPYHLKRRILSARGHLSNAAAAHAVETLASNRLKRVVALHRSRTNNTAALAGTVLRERLRRLSLDVPVEVIGQDGAPEE